MKHLLFSVPLVKSQQEDVALAEDQPGIISAAKANAGSMDADQPKQEEDDDVTRASDDNVIKESDDDVTQASDGAQGVESVLAHQSPQAWLSAAGK